MPLLCLAVFAGCEGIAESSEDSSPRFTSVSTGNYHTCALDSTQRVWCWGAHAGRAEGAGDDSRPQQIASPHRFRTIAAGEIHTCGVTTDGVALCWGGNDWGQLGDGTRFGRNVPQPVQTPLRFAGIVAGGAHTCAWTADGTAYCWGAGQYGQLGTGELREYATTPVAVAGDVRFREISSAGATSCGIAMDGRGYCWGSGSWGQLGTGYDQDRTRPDSLDGGLRLLSISTDGFASCGVAVGGVAYCWGGTSEDGMLGVGQIWMPHSPMPVLGGHRFSSIQVGGNVCAISTDGHTYCWGDAMYGGNGDGTRQARTEPVRVAGGHRFRTLAKRYLHTCGLAEDGLAYCWGLNYRGMLGVASTGQSCTVVGVGEPCSMIPIAVKGQRGSP